MTVIGITGNIACGKSTVSRLLEELGAFVIDADLVAHQVMVPGTPVWQQVVDAFGKGVLCADGHIDRAKLGRVVFADAEALAWLERIVHPAVTERLETMIREATAPVVVIEAIKLIESGFHQRCDELWVVTCPFQQQVERLTRQRCLTAEEALLRIKAQGPVEEKLRLADVVIVNSGARAELRQEVQRQWRRLQDKMKSSTS